MRKKLNILYSGFKLFPILAIWLRFPGLICWVAVSLGIVTATFIPDNFWGMLAKTQQFYIIKIVSATISLCIAIFFSSRTVRFLAFFTLSLILCSIRATEQHRISTLLKTQQYQTDHIIYGKIVSYPAPFRQGYRFLIKCDTVSFDTNGLLQGKIIQCISSVSPVSTASVKIFGHCLTPAKPQRPYEFDESRNLLSKSIWAKMEADSIHILSSVTNFSKMAEKFRERVLTVLDRLHNPAHRGILQAAFLGESDYLPYEIKESFRKSGIYHLLAISGLHASMLIAATYFFLTLIPVGKNSKHIIALLVLWTYQIFIGFIPSLFRATIMATFIICSCLYQKKNYSLQSIGLAATFWLLHSPESLFLPGFQLSFSATIGIITLAPVLNRFCPKLSSPVGDFILSRIVSLFNISFSGFLSTLPVLIYHFGSISLFGLLANLVAVSTMSLCMWSFFISLLFESFINYIASISICISALMLDILIWISKLADHASWSSIKLDSPYPEILLCYILFLIGLVSIAKKHTATYMKWSLPIFLLILPAIYLVRTNYDEIYIDRFSSKTCNTLVVCWPHKGVWILCNGSSIELKRLYNFSIRSWMRHKRDVFLEKVFIYNTSPPQELIQIAPEFLDSSTRYQLKIFPYLSTPAINRKNQLLTYTTCNPMNIRLQISSGDNWINCNFLDTTVVYGIQNIAGTSISAIPASIKISR